MGYFKRSVSTLLAFSLCFCCGVKPQAKELQFEYAKTFLSSGTFTAPKDGLYQFYVIGPGGDGGKGGDAYAGLWSTVDNYSGSGGGAGGYGGYSLHRVYLESGEKADIQIDSSKTCLNVLSNSIIAESGGNGKDGKKVMWKQELDKNTGGLAGIPGKSRGGNIFNLTGEFTLQGGDTQQDYDENGDYTECPLGGYGGSIRKSERKYIRQEVLYGGSCGLGMNLDSYIDGLIRGADGKCGESIKNTNTVIGTPGSGGGGASSKRCVIRRSRFDMEHTAFSNVGGDGGKGALGGVVVEICTDITPPALDDIQFSPDRRSAILTATDESGIAGYYINDVFVKGETVTYTIPKDVIHLKVQAEDNAGIKSDIKEADVLPPAPIIVATPDKEWINAEDEDVSIEIDSHESDAFDGVKVYYKLGEMDAWEESVGTIRVDKTCTLYAKVTSDIGESEVISKAIKVDKVLPSVVISSVE